MRILLIEDDLDLAATVGEYMEQKGHSVEFAYDGRTGAELALTSPRDVVVLDLTLPHLDGLEVCRRIRREGSSTPLLMLTARDGVDDRVIGLEAGADDYLVKPFALRELLARLEAMHRRATGGLSGETIQVADIVFDPGQGRVTRAGRPIALHRIGELILAKLMHASPRIVTRVELEEAIWGELTPERDVLRSHLYLLRQAVDRPFPTALIQTVRGRGYRIVEPSEEPG